MAKEKKERDTQKEVQSAVNATFRTIKGVFSAILSVILTILIVGAIAGCIVVCAFAIYIANNVDLSVDDITLVAGSNGDTSTRICYYDENGNLVEDESQKLSSGGNNFWVSYDQIPENLVNAFIAIEDKRFWDHNGVDTITTVKAVANYFLPTGSNAGGSTITQQLVKNVTGDDDYTIQRKVQEIFRAIALEKELGDKTKILEMYMNIIYFNHGAYGVQEAAHVYFNKDVSELSLLECAAIAGIVQSPTKWDPIRNPDNNKSRRNDILTQMYVQGLITRAEFNEAYDAPLTLDQSETNVVTLGTTSWYTDAVISDAIELLMERYNVSETIATQMLYSNGYTIVTAMDRNVQDVLDKYYSDMSGDGYLPVSNVISVESSMIIMDPQTSNILGMVGGRGEKTGNRVFNLATQAVRQPGSSMKPIAVYAPAIEAGVINFGSVVDDIPFNFGTVSYDSSGKAVYSNPTGWPRNSNNAYRGLTTIEYAIAMSKNTVAVHTLSMLGINQSYDFLTNKLHISTLVSTDKNYAALGLGGLTYGVTLEEITAAYSIFSNNGVYTSPRTILEIRDNEGNVLIDNQPVTEIVLSDGNAQVMTKLLESVITYPGATASTSIAPLSKVVNVAGKTGTTNRNYDKWFIGYTPYYLGGIWTGFVESQDLDGTISNEHNVLWNAVMMELHQPILDRVAAGEEKLRTFNRDLLIEAKYCMDSGKLITSACEADPRGSRVAVGYFTKETLPSEECDCHVLVKYCKGHGIAGPNCPDSDCIYVGLLQLKNPREFPYNVYVTDGQYTYMKLGNTTPWLGDANYPFYWNLYSSRHLYSGKSYVSNGQQYNRYCTVHNG